MPDNTPDPAGTVFCSPEDDIQRILDEGKSVTLRAGRYEKPLTLTVSNTRLEAEEGAEVEFWRARVDVRDAENCLIRGLTFRQSPHTSIGIEKGCDNTRIEASAFYACGLRRGGVTIWLGDGTHHCAVRDCTFDLLSLRGLQHRNPSHVHSIAIMASQADSEGHVIERNDIRHYGYAIQLGATGTSMDVGGHIVRENTILCPVTDGIHVKHARCTIERNTIIGANMWSISSRAGFGNVFRENQCIDGYVGIIVRGRDHEVVDNKFIRMRAVPIILARAKANGDGFAAENTLVRGNSFEDCGGADSGRMINPIVYSTDQLMPEGEGGIADESEMPQRVE